MAACSNLGCVLASVERSVLSVDIPETRSSGGRGEVPKSRLYAACVHAVGSLCTFCYFAAVIKVMLSAPNACVATSFRQLVRSDST